MFFNNRQAQIIERNNKWYVETNTGYEGPFDTPSEAKSFLRLKQTADSARIELICIEDF